VNTSLVGSLIAVLAVIGNMLEQRHVGVASGVAALCVAYLAVDVLDCDPQRRPILALFLWGLVVALTVTAWGVYFL
jgi:hypothetical protein